MRRDSVDVPFSLEHPGILAHVAGVEENREVHSAVAEGEWKVCSYFGILCC
jgi:hypothetical protein